MGPITNVYVEPGTVVRKGQLLATIDDAIIRKSIDELQNRLDLATVVYSKQKNLWDQKIGTEIQFLQAKNNKDALDRAMSTANEQLSLTKIKSPINGTVDQVDIKVGEMANAMKPAMRVVNLQQLKVTAELAESYLKAIKIGDKAKVTLPDLNKMIDAKVSFVGRVINPSSRTFSIDVKIGNSNDLRPNMIAMLNIIDYKAKNVFPIPMNIVQNDQAGQFVMVAVKNGDKIVASKRVIKTGLIYKGTVEVKSGLTEGEELIITGYQNLNEGDLIKL
jgi:RND family efflux transporter MFP subunit